MTGAWRGALRRWREALAGRRFFSRDPEGPRFHGVFPSRTAALGAIRPPKAAGYDHMEVTALNFARMCAVAPWDEPVIAALARLLPGHGHVLDAGGHLGTKYRAFRDRLPALAGRRWTVWELPAMAAEGERRARDEGLDALGFTADLAAVPADHDLLLASGLLQYLDGSLHGLLRERPELPRAVILNKVAVTDGPDYFMLENLVHSAVPYHVRREADVLDPLLALGYRLTARWEIAELAQPVPHHPERGTTRSIGAVLERP